MTLPPSQCFRHCHISESSLSIEPRKTFTFIFFRSLQFSGRFANADFALERAELHVSPSSRRLTASTMENSPLRKLPAELRNQIYELVLTEKYPIVTSKGLDYRRQITYLGKRHQMGITRTCKEIHAESANLFHALNTFVLQISQYSLIKSEHHLEGFRSQIGAARAMAIRVLIIDGGEVSDMSPIVPPTLFPVFVLLKKETERHLHCRFGFKFGIMFSGDPRNVEQFIIDLRDARRPWDTAMDRIR